MKRLLYTLIMVLIVIALGLGTTSLAYAVEETTDIVFDTLERVERRTAGYEERRVGFANEIRRARQEAESAIEKLSRAEAEGDEVAVEEARADLVKATATELAAKRRQVDQAFKVYGDNHRDLEVLLRHFQRSPRSGEGQDGEEAFVRTLRITQQFGTNVKQMLLSFSDLARAARDPQLRSKLASAAGSLQAVNRGLEAMNARVRSGSGDPREVARKVSGYMDALDSAIAQLVMARRFLDEEETKLQVANHLSLIRLISRRVAGVDLKPHRPTDLFERFLHDTEEMNVRTDSLLFPPQEKEENFDAQTEMGELFQE